MAKKEFDLSEYITSQQTATPTVEYKQDNFVRLPEAVQQAIVEATRSQMAENLKK